jgi:hypothetical protein
MTERDDDALRAALKDAMPPSRDVDLRRDLWPGMARRLSAGPTGVAWLDWGLAAAVILWLLLFPEILLPLLYHL